jgi:hypothetical protein
VEAAVISFKVQFCYSLQDTEEIRIYTSIRLTDFGVENRILNLRNTRKECEVYSHNIQCSADSCDQHSVIKNFVKSL